MKWCDQNGVDFIFGFTSASDPRRSAGPRYSRSNRFGCPEQYGFRNPNHKPTATAAFTNSEHINAPPFWVNARQHWLDRLVVVEIDLIPIAVFLGASISATVRSPVMSRASASNSA